MSFPRYPAYKDSGVEWLGEVPGHWKAVPLKTVSTHNDDVLDESTAPDAEIAYIDISSVDAINGIKTKEDMLFSAAPSRARRRVKHGDVIVSTVRTYLKAIARIRDPEENLVVSTGFAVIRPRGELAPDFLGHLVSAGFFVDQVIARSTGVSYPAINASELVAISVPVPPLPEQAQIAAFLDRETAKIDALVAEQRRLMALLREKRQAVISHAVTRGLNPDAPMKSSGIEWLGDVPEHWAVTPIGHLSEYLSYGFTNPMPTTDEGPYMLTANDVDYGKVKYDSARRTSFDAFLNDVTEKSRPKRGDILITKDGTLGRVAIHEGQEACINQSVALLRVKQKFLRPEFMAACLLGGLYQGRMIYDAGGTTIKHIYISRLAKMPIAYPSLFEQDQLLVFLETELAKFDTLTTEAQRAIDLLQEHRTALISAAVTGQIDVRGVLQ